MGQEDGFDVVLHGREGFLEVGLFGTDVGIISMLDA